MSSARSRSSEKRPDTISSNRSMLSNRSQSSNRSKSSNRSTTAATEPPQNTRSRNIFMINNNLHQRTLLQKTLYDTLNGHIDQNQLGQHGQVFQQNLPQANKGQVNGNARVKRSGLPRSQGNTVPQGKESRTSSHSQGSQFQPNVFYPQMMHPIPANKNTF